MIIFDDCFSKLSSSIRASVKYVVPGLEALRKTLLESRSNG